MRESGVAVMRSFRDISQASWSRVAGAEPELEHHPDYLAYLEDIDPRYRLYFALMRSGSVVAVSQAVMTSELTLPLSRPADVLAALPLPRLAAGLCGDADGAARPAAELARAEYERQLYPSIVIRNLWDCFPLIAADVADPRQCWPELIAAIEEHGDRAGARSVTWLNGPDPASPLGSLLISRGYIPARYCAVAEISLDGAGTFDGYLRRFTGDTRRGIRRERRRFRAAGLMARRLSPDLHLATAVSQEAANWARYGDDVDTAYLYQLRHSLLSHLRDRARLVGVTTADGAVIASGIHLVGARVYHVFTFGADYTGPDLTACYPELTFYLAIETALNLGLPRVNLGYEAYQGKVMRGAQLHDMHAYVLAMEPGGRRFAEAMLPEVSEVTSRQLAGLTRPRLTGAMR